MPHIRPLLSASVATLIACSTAQAAPKVVASIKPVHSLVAGVMEGVATPDLIVDGAASPHTFSLRPSKARSLENAEMIVWVGPQIETFLGRPISNLGQDAVIVQLDLSPDLIKLPVREGATFEAHDHSHHGGHGDHGEHADHDDHSDHADHDDHSDHAGHDDHDDHDHDDHSDHAGHDDHADHDHDDHSDRAGHDDHADHDDHDDHSDHAGHDDHADHDDHDDHAHHDDHDDDHAGHDHAHAAFDSHFWLDPENAKIFVGQIADALAGLDPENATKYASNASQLTERLDQLETELHATLEPVKGNPFIVFHDAYSYFENRFGVPAAGSVTLSPEVPPGAERIKEIRDRVEELKVTCVFSEPQFRPDLVTVITEDTDASAGVLDPLGTDIDNGPDLYFELLRALAVSMRDCLTPR